MNGKYVLINTWTAVAHKSTEVIFKYGLLFNRHMCCADM